MGRVQDRTCGTQKARFVSWLQREKLGCELCWDPGPSVSPGHGHAQSTLHSEALLLLGAPCPPDSHLLSPECRSVSPRVAFRSWLTDMLSSNSLGAFALVVPLLELLVSSYLGLVLSPMRPTGNPSCNLGPLHLPVLPGVGALGLPGYLETRRSGSRARRARGRAEEQGVTEVGSGSGRESRPHQAPGPCTHPQPLPAVLRALAKDPPSGLKVVLKKGHPRPYFALGWSRELAHSPPPIKGTVLNAFLFHMTTCGTQLAPFFS